MKFEIDINVDLTLNGEEYEPTGEFREPKDGEVFITQHGKAELLRKAIPGCPRIILRKKWKWPKWLKARYIAMDNDGNWYAYSERPTRPTWDTGFWDSDHYMPLSHNRLINFFPPGITQDNWRNSLMENPNYAK